MSGVLGSPSAKSIKLESVDSSTHDDSNENMDTTADVEGASEESQIEEDNCSICLQALVDRTVIPKCSHEFCFECLLVWTEQSRRCPLCTQTIGDYLIHSIRSRYDYRKHYLPPLRKSPPPSRPVPNNPILQNTREFTRRRRRERQWGTRQRDNDESDRLERSVQMRRWIYRHDVYAKHVASNAFTKYRPYPTPAQFAASPELISRTTTFLRRELQVWEGLDVEFLTTLIISLMKSIDIRSESAVKLIAEFLDMDVPYTPGGRLVNAEHFAHEVYCYVRSPYKDLFVYDSVVQYDSPRDRSPPPNEQQDHRSRPVVTREQPGHSYPRQEGSSQAGPSLQRLERSESWSPSGRRYSPPPEINDLDIHDSYNSISKRDTGGQDVESSRMLRHREGSRHGRKHTGDGMSRKRSMSPSDDHGMAPSSKSSRTRLTPVDGGPAGEPVTRANTKGKQRENYRNAVSSPPRPSDFVENASGEASQTDYAASAEQRTRNDVDESQSRKSASNGNTKSVKLLRSARHTSLHDTVKAHLSRNDPSAVSSLVPDANRSDHPGRKGQEKTFAAGSQAGLREEDNWGASARGHGRAGATNATGGGNRRGDAVGVPQDRRDLVPQRAPSPAKRDGELSHGRASLDKQSNSGNLQGSAQEGLGLGRAPKIPGTQVLNMHAPHSIGEDVLIKTANSLGVSPTPTPTGGRGAGTGAGAGAARGAASQARAQCAAGRAQETVGYIATALDDSDMDTETDNAPAQHRSKVTTPALGASSVSLPALPLHLQQAQAQGAGGTTAPSPPSSSTPGPARIDTASITGAGIEPMSAGQLRQLSGHVSRVGVGVHHDSSDSDTLGQGLLAIGLAIGLGTDHQTTSSESHASGPHSGSHASTPIGRRTGHAKSTSARAQRSGGGGGGAHQMRSVAGLSSEAASEAASASASAFASTSVPASPQGAGAGAGASADLTNTGAGSSAQSLQPPARARDLDTRARLLARLVREKKAHACVRGDHSVDYAPLEAAPLEEEESAARARAVEAQLKLRARLAAGRRRALVGVRGPGADDGPARGDEPGE